jgi:hypothetical protein
MNEAKLIMRLSYGPKREMTILEAPGDDRQKPMIRIANRFLLESGFTVGSKVEVEYSDNFITINKI